MQLPVAYCNCCCSLELCCVRPVELPQRLIAAIIRDWEAAIGLQEIRHRETLRVLLSSYAATRTPLALLCLLARGCMLLLVLDRSDSVRDSLCQTCVQDAALLLDLVRSLHISKWCTALALLLVDMSIIGPFAAEQPQLWNSFCQQLLQQPELYFLHDVVGALAAASAKQTPSTTTDDGDTQQQ